MFCPKCGSKIDDDAVFCEECGQKLEKEEVMNEGSTYYLTSKKFAFTMVDNNGEKTFQVKEQ